MIRKVEKHYDGMWELKRTATLGTIQQWGYQISKSLHGSLTGVSRDPLIPMLQVEKILIITAIVHRRLLMFLF